MRSILGDQGAESWGEGKSKRAAKKIGEEKFKAREKAGAQKKAEDFFRTLDFFFADFFAARLYFPSPPLSAPGSPRMDKKIFICPR